jgi:hypothetical protein
MGDKSYIDGIAPVNATRARIRQLHRCLKLIIFSSASAALRNSGHMV